MCRRLDGMTRFGEQDGARMISLIGLLIFTLVGANVLDLGF
jgi:hypothetical protein